MSELQRQKPRYLCENCSKRYHQWENTCPDCGANALVPIVRVVAERQKLISVRASDLPDVDELRISTGRKAWDKVLDGGLVWPSSVLVYGEGGVGKTTLCLAVASAMSLDMRGSAHIGSAEMKQAKIRQAARRAKADLSRLLIAECDDAEVFAHEIRAKRPKVIVWDSIQAFRARGVCEEYEVTKRALAAGKDAVSLLISQVNARGDYRGDKRVWHAVDAVIELERDAAGLRHIVLHKHRFGPAPLRAPDPD